MRSGLKKSTDPRVLDHKQRQHDTVDNLSLNSHKDSGYRSGGSGDRNSASSNSSVSNESLAMEQYRAAQQQHSHLPSQKEGSRTNAQNYNVPPKQHQVEPPLPNKLVLPPKTSSIKNRKVSKQDDEDPYDHLPAHAGRPVQGQPLSLPQKKLPAGKYWFIWILRDHLLLIMISTGFLQGLKKS